MRRDLIKDVEIVEPPIGEISKKYSAFSSIKRACLGGCGCLLIVIIVGAIVLRLSMGSGPQNLKSVPENFPQDIPLYDKDNIERITFVSGKYKNRGVEIAAFFPKVILSPLFLAMNKDQLTPTSTDAGAGRLALAKNIWKMIASPVSDHRDTVQIEWKNMNAEPYFVIGYYKVELQKKGYKIDLESESDTVKQFSFSKDEISGSMFASSAGTATQGTATAILTVNLSPS
ncbi:hypothetical protein EPN28_02885 [Patescibacteria group bacterium]|nr:MAG: hypothetical protein EPN28_02885 [Patescibacteria group bacterium]